MIKMQNASEIAKREQRNRRIGGIVIIALLLLSTAGFALNGVGITADNPTREGLVFDGQSWIYYLTDQPIYRFVYGLDDLNFTNVDINTTLAELGGKNVYIDSENNVGTQEIAMNLGRHVSKIGEACYGSCERDLRELTCDTEDILIVVKSNYTGISEKDNCIFLEEDLKVIDSFLYRILGLN